MASDKRFERLSGIVQGQKSTYDIQVSVIPPKDPQEVQLKYNYDIKVTDVKTGELKKAEKFTLRQGQPFSFLEDLVNLVRQSAAKDFKD